MPTTLSILGSPLCPGKGLVRTCLYQIPQKMECLTLGLKGKASQTKKIAILWATDIRKNSSRSLDPKRYFYTQRDRATTLLVKGSSLLINLSITIGLQSMKLNSIQAMTMNKIYIIAESNPRETIELKVSRSKLSVSQNRTRMKSLVFKSKTHLNRWKIKRKIL